LRAVLPVSLVGTSGDDSLTGTAASDTLSGAEGNDTLAGGAGNDTLLGGLGNDLLRGEGGNDNLNGGDGNDTMIGGAGADFFDLNLGDDRVVIASVADMVGDSSTGFGAGDIIDLSAIAGLSFIGNAAFGGVAGQVRVNEGFGGSLLQIDADGNAGPDATFSLGFLPPGLPIEMASYGLFTVVAPRNLTGTAAAETLTGAANADTLRGEGGNDTLLGLAGNDSLEGGAGDDRLVGGLGRDTLRGGAGADQFVFTNLDELSFGFSVTTGTAEAIADLGNGDLLDFSAVAGFSFIGGAAFSSVAGQVRFAPVFDGFGNVPALAFDTNGNGATDFFLRLEGFTGTLAETAPGSRILLASGPVNLTGTAAAETLTGGAFNDTLSGLGGNDLLSGGDGNDSLVGGQGGDTLAGGGGVDRFVFADLDVNATAAGRDTIQDFAPGTGELIDLSQMDANADIAGNQTFSFIGSAVFTGVGQLRFVNGQLIGNTGGTTAAEFVILLTGVTSLAGTDLIL
jgi:Ca2+-binding RTX toxin-like protein